LWNGTAYVPLRGEWRAPYFEVHPDLQRPLSSRHREFRWNNSDYLVERWRVEPLGPHVREFADALVTSNGYIVDERECTAVRNGGCVARGTLGWSSSNGSLPRYAQVVTLAAHWGAAIWHFPMEALVALRHIDTETLAASVVHLPARNRYIEQWCDLAGVRWNKTVTGSVRAVRLLAPRMSVCGMPYTMQLDWLAGLVARGVGLAAAHLNIVIMRRTKSGRRVHNFAAVERIVHDFVDENGGRIVLHDDAQLPTLREQLRLFAHASIVIGPHGAGETMLIASKPGACLIELMETSWVNVCYMQVAYLRRHHYVGVPLTKGVVREDDVYRALRTCGHLGSDR